MVVLTYLQTSVALVGGAEGWSAVCDCGIFRSYSLTYYCLCYYPVRRDVEGLS